MVAETLQRCAGGEAEQRQPRSREQQEDHVDERGEHAPPKSLVDDPLIHFHSL